MFLKYRPACSGDLAECRSCLRDGFAYDDAALDDLTALWRELLRDGTASPMVIEDVSEPLGRRIVWFCMKVFVGGAYAHYLKTEAPPTMGRHILDQWRAGRSPLLDLGQIRRANSPGGAGVSILVLNSGSPPRIITSEKWPIIAGKVVEFMPVCAGGYRLTELLIEVYDDFTAAWVEGTGMRLRTDYADFYHCHDQGAPPSSPRARLYGVTGPEAASGTAAASLFHYESPCLFFTPAEQELLQWALFGEVDEELAAALSLSLAGVRKRWSSVYGRVAEKMPTLVPGETSAVRSIEKKRRLLAYLRHHLEELRPTERPKAVK